MVQGTKETKWAFHHFCDRWSTRRKRTKPWFVVDVGAVDHERLTAAIVSPRWLFETKTNGSITGDNLHLNRSFSSIRAEFGDRYRCPDLFREIYISPHFVDAIVHPSTCHRCFCSRNLLIIVRWKALARLYCYLHAQIGRSLTVGRA